eukprot:TRINITY_DN4334_c0_g1_i1.p1 TRINITY_DN4334_c0_g1~~TRINITY_DN4334_c0_g1_i1.p1  ORF type:complete len:493 (+),score=106.62 TRINITY_DN4334_c0_g1_i1:776-2254(+)
MKKELEAGYAEILPSVVVDCLMNFKVGTEFDARAQNFIQLLPVDPVGTEFLIQLFHRHQMPKIAIECNSLRMLKFLEVFMGKQFSSASRTLQNMLKFAVEVKKQNMAEFLIENGAANDTHFSFLLDVLESKMYKVAELLLYSNNALAHATALDDNNTNALGAICKISDDGIGPFVKSFLTLNPCAHVIADKRKLSALHIAAAHNAIETMKILMEEYPMLLRYRDAQKRTAYCYMAMEGRPTLKMAAALFEVGYKPNFEDLSVAITHKDLNAIMWMLDPNKALEQKGKLIAMSQHRPDANPHTYNLNNMKSTDGQSLLHLARGETHIMKFLLKKEPNLVNVTNSLSKTVLWESLEGTQCLQPKSQMIAQVLINAGASMDSYNLEGNTLLHVALLVAHPQQFDIVKTLIELGANVTVNPRNGQTTSLHMAIQTNNLELVKLVAEEFKIKLSPQDFRQVVYKEKDALYGLPPSKFAERNKNISKESQKFFSVLKK